MKRIRIYKVFVLLLTIVTVATACTQDLTETKNIASDEGLTVTIDDDEQATRAIVIDNPGIRLETTWTAGDQLGIFGAGQSNEPYTINASTISDDGRTAAFTSTASIPSGDLLAYYPYNANATQSDDQLHLTFPKTQHYTVAGSVPLPDPEACVMAGKGSEATGVNMRNVMAVLKVGQVFATPTTVKSVEFRDLSGKSVCGDYTVTMTGGIPQTTFDGTGDVLTLDMGEGVKAEDGSAFIVFLVVPARDYPKGFEITFVDTEGQRTVRTAGTKNGKTLNRSVVHPVGDIGTYQNVEGMSYELMPTAHIIKPDDLELVKILRLTTDAYALDYIRNKPDNFAFLGNNEGSATTTDFDPQTDTVWHIPQSLGFAAKLQARSNIGAQGALTAGSGITLFNDTISTEYTILPISQSDYDALQSKDSHTLYLITS